MSERTRSAGASSQRRAARVSSRSWRTIMAALVVAGIASAYLGVNPEASGAPIDGIHNIQHVVVIMQENRSFDTYFGTFPGANGIPARVCVPDPVNGRCVAPFHNPVDKNSGGPHGTAAARADIDGGSMDGFV